MDGLLNQLERVGDTVHRRALVEMDRSFGESMLTRLAMAGFDAAPRFLGHDDEGRQVLSWVEGEVRPPEPGRFDHDLPEVLRRVRRFHDLCPGACHNDLAPRNTVWTVDGPVFIDWDLCAPGRPVEDVAHVCWQFLGLGPQRPAPEVAPVLRRGVDAYGLPAADRSILVEEIAAWQQRCADGIEERAGRGEAPFRKLVDGGAVADIRASRAWVLDHRDALDVSDER
jgi:Ser/Thr protein kinase RdoA (MazF antagonist)